MAKRKTAPAPKSQAITTRKPRRAYEGAIVNRLTHGWVTSATSADAEIDGSLVKLRDRSRQLRRDSPYVRQAIRAIGANVIGRGIRMQSRVMMARGGRLNEPLNRQIETAWSSWSHADRCHVAGKLSLPEILRRGNGQWLNPARCSSASLTSHSAAAGCPWRLR